MKEVTGAGAEGQAKRQALGGIRLIRSLLSEESVKVKPPRVSFLSNFCFCFLNSQVPGLGLCGPWNCDTGVVLLGEQPAC